jgi:hypothetical protein
MSIVFIRSSASIAPLRLRRIVILQQLGQHSWDDLPGGPYGVKPDNSRDLGHGIGAPLI